MVPNQNPEQIARDNIDDLLKASGWSVQNKKKINQNDGFGQAIREPFRLEHVQDFMDYQNTHYRKETWNADTNLEGRCRKYNHIVIVARDKTSLDIFRLKDKSLADLGNLPDPEDLAEENTEAGLNSFREIAQTLNTQSVIQKKHEQPQKKIQ